MSENTFDQRLVAAEARLRGLAATLEAGGPWPLAARFDHSTEASWGPRETLAHVEEMLSFWLGEAERILDGGGDGGPVVFGRQARTRSGWPSLPATGRSRFASWSPVSRLGSSGGGGAGRSWMLPPVNESAPM